MVEQVTKVRVHLLVGNTYHARVHYAPSPAMRAAGATGGEVDVDARPSDAINLAVRFKAPLYISKEVRRDLVMCCTCCCKAVTAVDSHCNRRDKCPPSIREASNQL